MSIQPLAAVGSGIVFNGSMARKRGVAVSSDIPDELRFSGGRRVTLHRPDPFQPSDEMLRLIQEQFGDYDPNRSFCYEINADREPRLLTDEGGIALLKETLGSIKLPPRETVTEKIYVLHNYLDQNLCSQRRALLNILGFCTRPGFNPLAIPAKRLFHKLSGGVDANKLVGVEVIQVPGQPEKLLIKAHMQNVQQKDIEGIQRLLNQPPHVLSMFMKAIMVLKDRLPFP